MTLFFPQNYILPECKPEWNREAITVFSRLPSLRRLQATPPLQTSLLRSKTLSVDIDQSVVFSNKKTMEKFMVSNKNLEKNI